MSRYSRKNRTTKKRPMHRYNWTAGAVDENKRLDAFVSEKADDVALTRSYIQKIIEQDGVSINGTPRAKNYKIKPGDIVTAQLSPPEQSDAQPQDIPMDIVYEDNWLVVVNKPQGMVVHPAPGNPDGTLVNALLYHCGDSLSGINGTLRPGIVHRIDKDTSGLLVVAKNDEAHLSLARQFEQHTIARRYLAVVHGVFGQQQGTINLPIGRSDKNRKKYAVTMRNGKNAVTHYTVLEQMERFTLVELRLETGRTHQIRVHMAHIGHPVAGDPVYGPKNAAMGLIGQCLHAAVLGFTHPQTGEYMEFKADVPAYFTDFFKKQEGGAHGA